MFTSNGLNPYPQYYCTPSSSSYNPIPPIVNQDVSPDHDLFFHQNHQDPLSAPFLLHNTQIPQPAALMNLASFPNAAVSAMTSQDHNETCVNLLGKKTTKKDRHSKIYTAHGLRDRRVRLSIEIAREFFDLQDMLGFDKASKTVEWLLSKSKSSIKELEMSQSSNANNEMAIDHNGDLEGILGLSRSKYSMMGDVSDMMSQEDGLNAIAKDSRAKARARARERTKEKILCTRSTCEQDYSNLSPQMLNQFKAMNHYQLEDHSHRSNFCSMTDMNLSTELQINGRNY